MASRPSISTSAFHFSVLVLLMKSARVRPRRRNVSRPMAWYASALRSSGKTTFPPSEPFVKTSTEVTSPSSPPTYRTACWRPSWLRSSISPVKYHSNASAIVLLPVPLSPYTAMLSPWPKSTVISPGTPRKARITSRSTFSLTAEILEELSDRLRAVHVFLLQDLHKTSGEIRRQVLHRFEKCQKELVCAGTVHGVLLVLRGNDRLDLTCPPLPLPPCRSTRNLGPSRIPGMKHDAHLCRRYCGHSLSSGNGFGALAHSAWQLGRRRDGRREFKPRQLLRRRHDVDVRDLPVAVQFRGQREPGRDTRGR